MFEAFTDLRKRFENINQNVLINTILKQPAARKLIIKQITEVQLFELNIDSKGKKLAANRSGYSDETLRLAEAGEGGYKRPKRGRDRIDLNATGDYYESHGVSISNLKNDYFEVFSDPIKDDTDLIEEWGEILGLAPEQMEVVAEFIAEQFTPLLLEQL